MPPADRHDVRRRAPLQIKLGNKLTIFHRPNVYGFHITRTGVRSARQGTVLPILGHDLAIICSGREPTGVECLTGDNLFCVVNDDACCIQSDIDKHYDVRSSYRNTWVGFHRVVQKTKPLFNCFRI